jgi:uncharacterized membrane protein
MMTATKPWYKSSTIAGIIVVAIALICRVFGIDLPVDEQGDELNSVVLQLMEMLGLVIATIGRLNAEHRIA